MFLGKKAEWNILLSFGTWQVIQLCGTNMACPEGVNIFYRNINRVTALFLWGRGSRMETKSSPTR